MSGLSFCVYLVGVTVCPQHQGSVLRTDDLNHPTILPSTDITWLVSGQTDDELASVGWTHP